METTTVKLYSLDYSNVKTYWAASLFIIGNILFPQLFHLIPQGGITWLPIYFFTLIGAYKYGWKVGLLTAVLSLAINSLLFSMPAPATLPVILLKSVLLAIAAGWTAQHFRRISVIMLIGVVFAYQVAYWTEHEEYMDRREWRNSKVAECSDMEVVYDRVIRGKVIDYIGFRSKYKFLSRITANLADFYVVIGGVLAALGRKK